MNPIVKAIQTASKQTGIPTAWLEALGEQESGNREVDAAGRIITSPVGALGWGQLMPATAAGLGVDPRDLEQNVLGAARYLKSQYDRFHSLPLALAAYNAGPGAVAKYGGVPPYSQTQNYVKSILAHIHGGQPSPGVVGAVVPTAPRAAAAAPPAPPSLSPLLAGLIQSNNQIVGLPSIQLPVIEQQKQPVKAPVRQAKPAPAPAPKNVRLPAARKSGSTIRFLEHYAEPFGLTVTSTTGGKHARGSYHYRGRAVDFGGDPTRMAALAKSALKHPQDFTELFYTGPGSPGFYIKNGKVFPNSQLDPKLFEEHTNHVHLAR